jgi:hypothetical protein
MILRWLRLLAGAFALCVASPQPLSADPRPIRLLMVGNSLTEANDLPAMVATLAHLAGDDPPIEVSAVVIGGSSLQDQLDAGAAAFEIARGGWDVVSLQQGPSTLPESRVELIESARRFDVLIRAAGGRPALYGVWPPLDRVMFLDDSIESYRQAAVAVGGLLFPAGLAWKTAWQMDPSLPLYGGDNFHPSPLGSYLAAIVIYAVLTGDSPVGLPSTFVVNGVQVSIPVAQAEIVQAAAAQAAAPAAGTAAPRSWGAIKQLYRD